MMIAHIAKFTVSGVHWWKMRPLLYQDQYTWWRRLLAYIEREFTAYCTASASGSPGTRCFTVGPWWVRDSPESPGVTFPEHGRGHSGTVGVQGDSGKGPECDTAGPLYRTAHIDRYIYTGERKSQILK